MKGNNTLRSSIFFCLITASIVIFAEPLTLNAHAFVDHYSYEIEKFFSHYKRPFTVLCIGSTANTIGLAMAKKFQHSIFVLTNEEKKSNNFLACLKEEPHNVVFIAKNLSSANLSMMSQCEHFDLVITYDIDEYNNDQYNACSALLSMGDYVLLKTSIFKQYFEKIPKTSSEQLQKSVSNQFKVENAEILLIKTHKQYLQKKWWGNKRDLSHGHYKVVSNFRKKNIHKERDGFKIIPWVHGINLTTFYMLSGNYPSRGDIVKALINLKHTPHNNSSMTNIIIQGKSLRFIDFDGLREGVSKKINNVIAAFKGEKVAFNSSKNGFIKYRTAP